MLFKEYLDFNFQLAFAGMSERQSLKYFNFNYNPNNENKYIRFDIFNNVKK